MCVWTTQISPPTLYLPALNHPLLSWLIVEDHGDNHVPGRQSHSKGMQEFLACDDVAWVAVVDNSSLLMPVCSHLLGSAPHRPPVSLGPVGQLSSSAHVSWKTAWLDLSIKEVAIWWWDFTKKVVLCHWQFPESLRKFVYLAAELLIQLMFAVMHAH